MNSRIQPLIAEIETLCRQYRVKRLDIFGSATTGEFKADSSDLDFLVEFEEPLGPGYADRYFGLLESLEALLGRPVDLVVASAVRNPYFLETANRTRVPVYAG